MLVGVGSAAAPSSLQLIEYAHGFGLSFGKLLGGETTARSLPRSHTYFLVKRAFSDQQVCRFKSDFDWPPGRGRRRGNISRVN